LTVKAGSGLTRTEVEVPLDVEEAEELWPHTHGRRINKVRHRVEIGSVLVDVDVYGGPLEGLCTAEVEFASEAAARAFEPPGWFGREVTGVTGWDNASLSRNGAPLIS
ncbi:MAG: adenylate cyclase, partial [Acidimicrobiales bacterium]